jgi:hypothetical protein
MRHRCAYKIDDEADADHSEEKPPDTKNYAYCNGKLTCCEEWKVLQRHADDFVNDQHCVRVAANLPNPGKRHAWVPEQAPAA